MIERVLLPFSAKPRAAFASRNGLNIDNLHKARTGQCATVTFTDTLSGMIVTVL